MYRLIFNGQLIALVALALYATGCISLQAPTPREPHSELGHWQTYHFQGEHSCSKEGLSHRGKDAHASYIDGGVLDDGTIWTAMELHNVIPWVYTPSEGDPIRYNIGCTLVFVNQMDEERASEVWLQEHHTQSVSIDSPDYTGLAETLSSRNYKQLEGIASVNQDDEEQISFEINGEVRTQAIHFSLQGELHTQLHYGQITTTYNSKGFPFSLYDPWTSQTWR